MDPAEHKDERPKKFTLNEPCIIISIVGLTLLSGMSTVVQNQQIFKSSFLQEASLLFDLCQTVIPVPGIIALAFLSEFNGRKPIFIILCAASVLTSTMAFIPPFWPMLMTASVIHAIVNWGLAMMNMVFIPEYCRPRHRFLCLVLSQIAFTIGATVTNTCLNDMTMTEIYFKVYGTLVSVACLGSACVWPESPYWLAARGLHVDAAYTLRKLRGESAENELSQLQSERISNPIKVIGLYLFCVLSLSSVSLSADTLSIAYILLKHFNLSTNSEKIVFVIGFCLLLLISALSYRVKRKVIYLTSNLLALASGYVLAVFIKFYPDSLFTQFYIGICQILCFIGPECLTYILASELLPFKYNTALACTYCVFFLLSRYGAQLLVKEVSALRLHKSISLLAFNTMVIPGLIVSFFLARETKDKTLFEIQKSYEYNQETTINPGPGLVLQQVTPVQADEPHTRLSP